MTTGSADRPYVDLGDTDRPSADQHHDAVELLVRQSLHKFVAHLVATVQEQARITGPLVAEEIMEKAYRLPSVGDDVRLMGQAVVTEYLRLPHRQRVQQLRRAKSLNFPRPVQELKMGPVWLARDIELWEKSWERKKGRPRKKETL